MLKINICKIKLPYVILVLQGCTYTHFVMHAKEYSMTYFFPAIYNSQKSYMLAQAFNIVQCEALFLEESFNAPDVVSQDWRLTLI